MEQTDYREFSTIVARAKRNWVNMAHMRPSTKMQQLRLVSDLCQELGSHPVVQSARQQMLQSKTKPVIKDGGYDSDFDDLNDEDWVDPDADPASLLPPPWCIFIGSSKARVLFVFHSPTPNDLLIWHGNKNLNGVFGWSNVSEAYWNSANEMMQLVRKHTEDTVSMMDCAITWLVPFTLPKDEQPPHYRVMLGSRDVQLFTALSRRILEVMEPHVIVVVSRTTWFELGKRFCARGQLPPLPQDYNNRTETVDMVGVEMFKRWTRVLYVDHPFVVQKHKKAAQRFAHAMQMLRDLRAQATESKKRHVDALSELMSTSKRRKINSTCS